MIFRIVPADLGVLLTVWCDLSMHGQRHELIYSLGTIAFKPLQLNVTSNKHIKEDSRVSNKAIKSVRNFGRIAGCNHVLI